MPHGGRNIMEKVELEAVKRVNSGTSKSRNERLAGTIPAIVYGKGSPSVSVSVDSKTFVKMISAKAGRNVIISLKINDNGKQEIVPVLTHDIQRNAINDKIIHIDFYKVNMKEQIKTKVPVHMHGEAIGVKLDGGILVQGLRQVEIKCLPDVIPDKFDIDVSELKIGASLHVSDLKLGKDFTIVTPGKEILVTVTAPAKEEVEAAPLTAPEVTGQAVPAEGAAAAAPAAGGKEAAPAAKGAAAAPAAGAAPAKGAAAPAAKAAPAADAKKK
jgi:large subunit ribosomal protein L25